MATAKEPHTRTYSHINGTPEQLLDRLAVTELCKGWPVYRDNSEWENFRSLFTKNATVWTTWSGARHIDDFINISKEGKDKGVSILHRENGTLVELNSATGRAVGKMKATITQRFTHTCIATGETFQYDVDCDCRFLFFCLRDSGHTVSWRVAYAKLVYEKDKVVPVDGKTVPDFQPHELHRYPPGYQYLGAAQARLGYDVDPNLVTLTSRYWSTVYECMEKWLGGDHEPGLFWDSKGKPDWVSSGSRITVEPFSAAAVLHEDFSSGLPPDLSPSRASQPRRFSRTG